MNITRYDLTAMISEKMPGIEPEIITKIVNRIFEIIIEELKNGNKIEFRNFGRFKIRKRRGRMAHNPKTLEKVEVPPKNIPVFKIGKMFKDEIARAEKKNPNKLLGKK
ncbi:integration host factor subunit beta [Candidatus Dependentiae bacterium]|nr:integration host factor subunit beta [Candidatus Dependentiae bacterium]